MFEKYEFNGNLGGKRILILGAVHGNETAGTKAIERVKVEIEKGQLLPKCGKVVLVPVVNVEAYEKGLRYVNKNLNRIVTRHESPSCLEEKIADALAREIEAADVVLDLHSTHCRGDVAFAFLDYPTEDNCNLIEMLNIEYVLCGWPEMYLNQKVEDDFSTEKYAHVCGKAGITLECGFHGDEAAITVAYEAIRAVLSGVSVKNAKTYVTMKEVFFKQKNGVLLKSYKHLDRIEKGEVLAKYDNGQEILAPNEGYIIIPNHDAKIGDEWFYFGLV